MIPDDVSNQPFGDSPEDKMPISTPVPQSFEHQIQSATTAQEVQHQSPTEQVPQGGAAAAAGVAVAQFQRVQASAAQVIRPLTDTVWSKLDRKATAVAEFTLRQYRTKNSTWVVLGIGVVFVAMILMFYGEAMATGFESVDNDGDSEDWDGDGYPTGQERRYNTNPWDGDSHPDPNIIAPDPPEKWIDEDGIDWDGNYNNWNQGHDDDGDCTGEGWVDPDSFELPREQDRNHDNVDCNVHYYMNSTTNTVYRINSDPNVDEDPNDELFLKESLHRAFVLGFGKIGFGFLIGIFVPLFLATGLVRDEMENGTLHYIMGKPIARAEILAYRLLGYIAMVWPYSTVLILLTGIITGFLAPSESLFRFHDMSAWLGVLLASWLVMLAYGTIFCTLGIMSPKFGLWIAIGLGVWEFAMAMMSLAIPTFPLTWLSISHWGIEIINCTSILAYPDQSYMIHMASEISWGSEIALAGFYSPPSVVAGSPFISLLVSILVLLTITIGALFVGQSSLKNKELN
ncbi:MAG: ABC transporter permease [Candidatus Thalassarchaeaceae archaeon]|jgi:hypothetical protein|nr:ABC transporter permease [Candidatus Thalassarchaeaceae archaeon]MDP7042768.1 ABC transporter permease [Candidatus Thalassarchaeaceae archaeon]